MLKPYFPCSSGSESVGGDKASGSGGFCAGTGLPLGEEGGEEFVNNPDDYIMQAQLKNSRVLG